MARRVKTHGWMTIVPLIATHAVFVWLTMIDRLVFGDSPGYPFLEAIVDSELWGYFSFTIMLMLTTSIWVEKMMITALSASSGMLGTFGVLSLLWALGIENHNVSLLGPLLSIVAGLASYVLALAFAGGTLLHPKHRQPDAR